MLRRLLDKELGKDAEAIDQEEWGFVVHFYTYALVGMLLEWMDDGMKTEPEVLTRRLNSICSGGIQKAAEMLGGGRK